MRIVIEIDQSDTGAESGTRSPTASVRVVGAAAQAPESAPAPSFPEAPPTVPGADPMSTDAGAAATLAPAIAGEVAVELLARAAALNALDAGPAPGYTVGSPVRTVGTVVTEADSSVGVLALHNEPSSSFPSSGLEAVHEGGATNAGPAPM